MDEAQAPANPPSRPSHVEVLKNRLGRLLVPPWIQVGATLLCGVIIYGVHLWVHPVQVRLKLEREALGETTRQVRELEGLILREKEQDLQARLRGAKEVTVNSGADLEKAVLQMKEILKKEAWKAKIIPAKETLVSSKIPGLWVHEVIVEVSVPPEISASTRDAEQIRLGRLLRRMAEIRPRHQLIALEVRSAPEKGFSAKLTYHFYRIKNG